MQLIGNKENKNLTKGFFVVAQCYFLSEEKGMQSIRYVLPAVGFAELPPDDQLILLKTGFIDIWLILNSVRLTHVKDSITLYDGTQIPICEVTTIYTVSRR